MRIPLELEHLIKTAIPELTAQEPIATQQSQPKGPNSTPKPHTLASQLLAVEWERALEVEHYLRVCAIRLGLPEAPA